MFEDIKNRTPVRDRGTANNSTGRRPYTAKARRPQRVALKRRTDLRQRQLRRLRPCLDAVGLFDRFWFEDNPNRQLLLRPAHWCELAQAAAVRGRQHREFGRDWFTVVQQIEPGVYWRRVVRVPGSVRPENFSEADCRLLLQQSEVGS